MDVLMPLYQKKIYFPMSYPILPSKNHRPYRSRLEVERQVQGKGCWGLAKQASGRGKGIVRQLLAFPSLQHPGIYSSIRVFSVKSQTGWKGQFPRVRLTWQLYTQLTAHLRERRKCDNKGRLIIMPEIFLFIIYISLCQ